MANKVYSNVSKIWNANSLISFQSYKLRLCILFATTENKIYWIWQKLSKANEVNNIFFCIDFQRREQSQFWFRSIWVESDQFVSESSGPDLGVLEPSQTRGGNFSFSPSRAHPLSEKIGRSRRVWER